MQKEALFWQKLDNDTIQCQLCPHRCKMTEGQSGICKVRGVSGGKLYSLYHEMVAVGGQIDPIEKKPLYNFYPGSKVLSFGGIGCNLQCAHCQNYTLSQEYDKRYVFSLTPEQIVQTAKKYDCPGVAWTYNEPIIYFETYYEWSQIAKANGLFTVLVSNGYINPEPFQQFAKFLDAANIDVKAFTENFYQKYTKSRLQPVLDTCILARKLNVHLEITYLIIPTLNDSLEEIGQFLDWASQSLGHDVPLHFSSFHPDYQMSHLPPTPPQKVIDAVELGLKKQFKYVYAGNLYGTSHENTVCPSCKAVVIKRSGYTIKNVGVTKERKCKFCNTLLNMVL